MESWKKWVLFMALVFVVFVIAAYYVLKAGDSCDGR
jgi:hypothetical protein